MAHHDKIRTVIADDYDLVNEFMLTELEYSIFHFIRRQGTVFANQVTRRYECSAQQTSVYLKQLFDKGYLNRKEQVAASGGIEYEYKARI